MYTTAPNSLVSRIEKKRNETNEILKIVTTDLNAEPLELASGVIWTALNVDYPSHSFSHLGLFFGKHFPKKPNEFLLTSYPEGLNGRLPNQDLMNSVQRIARFTGQVPVTVYDHLEWRESSAQPSEFAFLPTSLRHSPKFKDFNNQAKNILRHIGYQARGRASGVHGLFHQ